MNTAKDTIKDLISDIRFSQRKINAGMNIEEEINYLDLCRQQMIALFRHRHDSPSTLFDHNGWPKLREFNSVKVQSL